MEKNIWVLDQNKSELSGIQQKLNSTGGLRTFCMLTGNNLKMMIEKCGDDEDSYGRPSLIMFDYSSMKEVNFEPLEVVQNMSKYAGVPVAFLVEKRTEEIEDECFDRGATLVLAKPLTVKMAKRIEKLSWQYEMTRNYQKILQEQVYEIKAAREIKELNAKLESRNKLLKVAFGKYFSNEVVDVILNDPHGVNIGGEKKILTVMMADIRGFTPISEENDAETITNMINNFLGKMTDVILSYKGTVIEFIGDAILAVFGAPYDTGHPEMDAVAAAIDMQNAMKEVNEFNRTMGYPRIQMGIGLHKGEMFIGNIGSEKMMRYNIIGSTVNLCSRIESQTVAGQIFASDELVNSIRDNLEIVNSTEIVAKGISYKVPVHDICGIDGVHKCSLNKKADDEITSLKSEIEVSIFVINNGEIDLKPHYGVITAMSTNCASIEMKGSTLDIDTNVELIATDKSNAAKIRNNYGSVAWKDGNQIMVKFTRTTLV